MARSDAPARRIAIIGFGSLIWDLDDLAPKIRGDWSLGAGPAFPLEFSRISQKRGGALTLVIDATVERVSQTAAIESVRDQVAAAAEDLAARERAPVASIGWCDVATDEARSRHPTIGAIVSIWCRSAGWDGAVWTDLASNFAIARRERFSVEAARAYLTRLDRSALDRAVEYIENAPAATSTPLRDALAQDDWWRAEAARFAKRAR